MRLSAAAFALAAISSLPGAARAVPVDHFYATPVDAGATLPSVVGSTARDLIAGVNQRSPQSGDSVGFMVDPAGTSRRLPAAPGLAWSQLYAISDAGRVLGLMVPADGTPGGGFYLTAAHGRRPLQPVSFPGQLVAMNDGGQMLGYAIEQVMPIGNARPAGAVPLVGPFPVSHCLFSDATDMPAHDMGALGGPGAICEPSAINAAGQVTGRSALTPGGTPDHVLQAFLSGPGGAGLVNLGSLADGQASQGTALNGAGVVVGWSTASDFFSVHAFITGPGGAGMRDLGTLGGDDSSATGVNSDGNVVGFADDAAGNSRAFVTGNDGVGMLDLLAITKGLPRGTMLQQVVGINDLGHVLVIDREQHGWVLCPRRGCR